VKVALNKNHTTMTNDISIILQKATSFRKVTLDSMQTSAALVAMNDYAIRAVAKYRDDEQRQILKESLTLFPALWAGELKLWLRLKSFNRAKRMAQLRADSEGYKIYVILSSQIRYTLLSTAEVDFNKRVRILGKNVTDMELTKKAAFVATKRSGT
jgi:hypothetical protein